MRRRKFIALIGGATIWSLGARAQQANRPRQIAVLMGTVETAPDAVGLKTVLDRLNTLGWTQGVTARIDIRWSKTDPDLMRENAQALLALSPDVILCHSNPALAQLRPLAAGTPIVFVMVADPVGSGFVDNLAHPGGNITGFTNFEPSMGGKWVEMLKEIAPNVSNICVLMHPETKAHLAFWREAAAAAVALRIEPHASGIHTAEEIEQRWQWLRLSQAEDSSCSLIRSLRFTGISLLLSQRGGVCRQCTPFGPILWQALLPPMVSMSLITSGRQRTTSTASSKEKNLPTFQCKRRQNLSWSLTLKPPRRSD
jgi:ABC-type uncharacterized transport system substrate-binding protein